MKTKLAVTHNAALLIAGSLLILIAILILSSPVDFYASNNIELGSNVSLLNELKAPAGFLLASGLFIFAAMFVKSQVDIALSLAALIYLSFAVSRFLSMVLDGMPASGLVQAFVIETIVGAVCLLVLMFRRALARKAV